MRSFRATKEYGLQAPDPGPRLAFAPDPSDHIDAIVLVPDVAQVHPIPEGANYVLFASTADFFAKFGADDVDVDVPTSNTTNGSSGELNPNARNVPDGATHIALVSEYPCLITLAFYRA